MIRCRSKFPAPEALRMHLRMTHGQYVTDVKGSKALLAAHEELHVDMETHGLPHGTVAHFHGEA